MPVRFAIVMILLAAILVLAGYLLYRYFRHVEEQQAEVEVEREKSRQKLFDDEDL